MMSIRELLWCPQPRLAMVVVVYICGGWGVGGEGVRYSF